MLPPLHFAERATIDINSWDASIYSSSNGLIYSTSKYLDEMCDKNWGALVTDDYSILMPLPYRRKYGISYIFQPAFTQQLGIIKQGVVTKELVDYFIKNIPTKFLYIELNLNAGNGNINHNFVKKKNYLLDISADYPTLYKAYSRSAKRNIQKAITQQIAIVEDVSALDIINLHRQRFNDDIGATAEDYKRFQKLTKELLTEGQCFTIGAFTKNNVLIAGSIYWLYKNRLTFIFNGNSQESLQYGATHYLKDSVIKKFSGKDLWIDFEGSDFEQFARFYDQFGNTQIEEYPSVIINKLPWPLSVLKR